MTNEEARAGAAKRRETSAAWRISHPLQMQCECKIPVPVWNDSCPQTRVCQTCHYPVPPRAEVEVQAIRANVFCTCPTPVAEWNGKHGRNVLVCQACQYVIREETEGT